MDDTVVSSRSPPDHIEQFRRVLQVFYEACVTVKLKKCKYFAETIDYLSHVIRPGRLVFAEHKPDVEAKLEHPTTQSELRSFLILGNSSRRFASNFARLAALLNKKLGKDQPKPFIPVGSRESDAVASLKEAVISALVLDLPRKEERYTICADACDKRVWCVLLQTQEVGSNCRAGYWSRILNNKENKLNITHRKCVTVIWADTLLRPYLDRTRVTIRPGQETLR